MADSEVTATLRSAAGEVLVQVEIGDGLAGYWTVALLDSGQPVRRWEGRSDDPLPDEVRLPAKVLHGGKASLTWSVLLYGPAHRASYHVQLRVSQDDEALLKRPVRLRGQVSARQTQLLSGVVAVVTGA